MAKKNKKTIDELKRDHKPLDKKQMDEVKGGNRRSWIRRICSAITPQ